VATAAAVASAVIFQLKQVYSTSMFCKLYYLL